MQRDIDRGTASVDAASRERGGAVAARTSWGRIGLLFLIGVTAALQVGKVPGQLPAIERELGLSLFEIGLIISIFSLIAAIGGIFVGALADRFGNLGQLVAGLALGGAASFAGSFATSGAPLLAGRVVEGFGFILATTATPALIVKEAGEAERGRALGLWSMYMPAGMSVMMMAGALAAGVMGWRDIWRLTAMLNLAYAAFIWFMFRKRATSRTGPAMAASTSLGNLFVTALRPGPLLLAGCFLAYAGNFLALTGFLPLVLEQRGDASAASAGLLAAIVVAANMLGNAASGFIAEHGMSRPHIIAAAAAITGIAGVGVFADTLPFALRYGLALVFAGVGGIIPGTCFGTVPSFAESPAKAGPIYGGLIQGAGVGQLIGPALVALVVQTVGSWRGAALFIAAGALVNVMLALALSRVTPKGRWPDG
ncbi:MAG: CynX/NimT family MFS transporter [Hyphomicrobiales bacterium]